MQTFEYLVSDIQGLHARNALSLCKLAEGLESNITICTDKKKANCKNMMELMSLGIKKDDRIRFVLEGADEMMALQLFASTLATIL